VRYDGECVGAPFNFHHKRILNLAVVSRFTGNVELTHAHPKPNGHGWDWAWAWAWVWAPNVGLWWDVTNGVGLL